MQYNVWKILYFNLYKVKSSKSRIQWIKVYTLLHCIEKCPGLSGHSWTNDTKVLCACAG